MMHFLSEYCLQVTVIVFALAVLGTLFAGAWAIRD
jgi:hypothetical protein